jgi:hypothetical protein
MKKTSGEKSLGTVSLSDRGFFQVVVRFSIIEKT